MASTILTPHLFPFRKTHQLHRRCHYHYHYHSQNNSGPSRFSIIYSSSSLQEIKKPLVSSPPPADNSEGRDLLSWKSITLPPIRAAKRVVLVRHGQSTWNAEGRIQGSSDFSVLTQKGEAQAETSRQMLLDDSFDVCFSRFIYFEYPFLNF
ncbi:Phosphoglycerate mutase [Abeliophyllum distichum]|uniref:Phosphoglycerate mutase n=1 Tax=Abeliophyllum distichum TaxID=126358 RepID=A0ABD1NTR5_9LAMI